MQSNLNLIVAITGASGVIYGVTLLKVLKALNIKTILVLSSSAITTLKYELDMSYKDIINLADSYYSNEEIGASIASGSFPTRGMVVAPCSIKTLSAIANCYSNNLINRASDVCLKERRKLILMVRETPLHLGHIKLMEKATLNGAIIMPPVLEFYTKPKNIEDIINSNISRVLDLLNIENNISPRWKLFKKG